MLSHLVSSVSVANMQSGSEHFANQELRAQIEIFSLAEDIGNSYGQIAECHLDILQPPRCRPTGTISSAATSREALW